MLEMSVKYIGRQGIVLLNCIVSCFLFILSHWLGICDGIDGIVDFTFMFSFLFAFMYVPSNVYMYLHSTRADNKKRCGFDSLTVSFPALFARIYIHKSQKVF